jgi:hypothetical protein
MGTTKDGFPVPSEIVAGKGNKIAQEGPPGEFFDAAAMDAGDKDTNDNAIKWRGVGANYESGGVPNSGPER